MRRHPPCYDLSHWAAHAACHQRIVSGGWPRILSDLKSLLETGHIILS